MQQRYVDAECLTVQPIPSPMQMPEIDLIHWLRIKDTTLELAREFPDLQTINIGGGLPVVYDEANQEAMQLREWGAALTESMRRLSNRLGREIDLQIEPGRFIVAQSGVLIAEAQAVKRTTQSDG